MLVMLGPDFEGTEAAYARLSRETGLVLYDLRARVRPGVWGVLKLVADTEQAEAMASSLRSAGFHPVLVDRVVAHEPERRIVPVRGLRLGERGALLYLEEEEIEIEYADVACIVRGEVRPGRSLRSSAASGTSSSSTFRAVVPGAVVEIPMPRDAQPSAFDSYHAADLHFASSPWIARLDARTLDTPDGEQGVRALDRLVDQLAERTGVRVDRGVRTSSVASLAEQPSSLRRVGSPTNVAATTGSARPPPMSSLAAPQVSLPAPSVRAVPKEPPDERFDPYSRLIAAAERKARESAASV